MNESNNDSCAICSKQPQDMLLLQCNHNLCLDCATQLFIASQNESLQCQICFITTHLDNETISCLTSLAKQLCSPAVKEPEPFIPKPPQRELIRDDACYEHREKALYYCFDCQIGTICSQCILGSSHSGHKVFTLKKATKLLEQQLIENSKYLEGLKGAIQQKVQFVRIKSNDLSKDYQEKQKKLKNVFDDIAKQVHERYTQLNMELERSSQRGIQIFEGCLLQLQQKLRLIDATIKQNKVIMQQNNSQLIIRRIAHLQIQKDYNPEIPSNLPQNNLFLSFQDSICLQLQQLMKRLKWEDSSQPQFQKQNRRQLYNINEDGSLLYEDKQRQIYPEFIGYQRKQKDLNQSVNKYSGIKSTSRRLQLSRSMDNATNIINKLQERIRR